MASTISAGTTSGTAIAIAGDTSGALALQTNNGTTAVTVDTSQNVGIGTASPSSYAKLAVYAGDAAILKAHGLGSYPSLILQNATAGTTYTGRILWKDGNGNANWGIGQNVTQGSGYLEFNNGATLSGYFDSSNNFAFNSGYGSAKVAYGCRAWVNFNGTNGTIRASGNVSSVTYNGVGDYTVNFSTAMVDANYCAVYGGSTDWRTIGSASTSDITTTYCRIYVRLPSSATASNVDTITLAIFR